ncbi:MAG: PAS domain S-box protein [Melioribacteraceae bacterium]|nr:PAS domain S-box protein [Melioribacteraceae bacterium]
MPKTPRNLKKDDLLKYCDHLLNKINGLEKCHDTLKKQLTADKNYHSIFNLSPVPLILINKKKQVELVSRSFTELTKYKLKDIPDWDSCLHIFNSNVKAENLKNVLLDKQTGNEKYKAKKNVVKVKSKDGKYYEFKISVSENGEFILLLFENIKLEQSYIRKIETGKVKYKNLIDSLNDAFYLWRINKNGSIGKCRETNIKACEMLGYTKKELLSFTPSDITSRKYKSRIKNFLQELKTNGHLVFQTQHIRKDGSLADVEVSSQLTNIDGKDYILSVARNITERLKSSGRYKNLFDQIPVGIHNYVLTDSDNLILKSANPHSDKLLGINTSQFINMKIEEAFPNLIGTEVPGRYKKIAANGGIWHAEEITYKDEKIEGAFEVLAFQTSINEMVATFTDITARKKTQHELVESEKRYRSLIEQSPLSIEIFNSEGTLIHVNNAWENLWGISSKEVLNKFNVFSSPETTGFGSLEYFREAFEGKSGSRSEIKYLSPDDSSSIRWLSIHYFAIKGEFGNVEFVVVFMEDISKRKETQSALKISEDLNKIIVENAHDGISITNSQYVFEYVNNELSAMTEIPVSELIGKDFRKFLSPDNLSQTVERFDKRYSGVKLEGNYELDYTTASGNHKIFEIRSSLLRDSDGKQKVLSHYKDITEQKRSQKIRDVIFNITNAVNKIESLENFGLFIKEQLSTLMPVKNYYIALYNKSTGTYRFPYYLDEKDTIDSSLNLNLDGTLTDYIRQSGLALLVNSEVNDRLESEGKITEIIGAMPKIWLGVPLTFKGEQIGVIAIQDYLNEHAYNNDDLELLRIISENISSVLWRMRYEEALRESEENYRQIFNGTSDAIIIYDYDTFRIRDVNNAALKMYDITYQEILKGGMEQLSADIHPYTAREALRWFKLAKEEGPQNFEWLSRTNTGKLFSTEISLKKADVGSNRYIIASVRDISRRKKSEEEYRQLAGIIDSTTDLVTVADENEKIVYINSAGTSLLGWNPEEENRKKYLKDICPDDEYSGTIINGIKTALKEGSWKGETTIYGSIKNKIPVSIVLIASKSKAGNLNYISAIMRNISEMKRVESQLRESEYRYRTLFETANDSIFLMRDDIFVDCNPKTLEIFGCERKDIIGKHPHMFSPDNQPDGLNSKEKARKKISDAIHGKSQTFQWQHKKLDGTLFDAEVSLNVVNLHGGNFIQAIVRDVTERKKEKEELEKIQSLLLAALEQNPAGIIIADAKEKIITFANSSAIRTSGLKKDTITGAHINEYFKNITAFHPDGTRYQSEDLPLRKALLKGETTESAEIFFFDSRKNRKWILINGAPITNSRGEIIAGIIIFLDITRLKNIEEALRLNEQHLRTLINSLPVIIWSTDVKGNFTFAEGRMLNNLKVSSGDILGRSLYKIYDKNDPMIINTKRALNGETFASGFEFAGIHFESHHSPIYDSNGEVQGTTGVAIDISARKKIENVLQTFAEDLSAITGEAFFKSAVEFIAGITDTQYCLIGEYESTGNSIKTIAYWENGKIGNNFSYSLKDTPSANLLKQTSQSINHSAYKLYSKDQMLADLKIEGYFGKTLTDYSEKPIGVLILLSTNPIENTEFTSTVLKIFAVRCSSELERLNYERQVINVKNEAEKANLLKSEFLAQMSHEIRTPINTILSFTSLIKDELKEKVSEDLRYGFTSIDSAGKRIIRTIDLILNMAEIQTGTYQPSFRDFKLYDDIIEELYSEFKLKAINKNLDLNIIKNVKNTKIKGDYYTVGQIVNNLLDNAIKYTSEGHINIIIDKNMNKELILIIEDTGIGISEEYLPNLFKPFSQEDSGYTRRFEGNGLGLALVKNYCDINASDISVESIKGRGTKFTITFNKRAD